MSWKNNSGGAVAIPNQPITNLASLSVSGTVAAGGDSITVSTGTNVYMRTGDNAVDAANGWRTAEFNVFGDGALIFGVGAKTGTAPGSTSAPLTEGGLFITVIVIAVFLARRGKGATASKWRGWFSGIGLALTGSIARYAAVPLASVANLAGAWLTGMMR